MRYISYIGGKHHPTPQQKKKAELLKYKEQQSKLKTILINYLDDENNINPDSTDPEDLDIDDVLFIRNNIDELVFFQNINDENVYFTQISTPQISFTITIEGEEVTIDKVYVD